MISPHTCKEKTTDKKAKFKMDFRVYSIVYTSKFNRMYQL